MKLATKKAIPSKPSSLLSPTFLTATAERAVADNSDIESEEEEVDTSAIAFRSSVRALKLPLTHDDILYPDTAFAGTAC